MQCLFLAGLSVHEAFGVTNHNRNEFYSGVCLFILTLLPMLHFNEASGFIFRLHFALSIMTVLIIESKLFLYISMGLLLLFWFWVYCLFACLLASVTTVVLYSVSMFSYMSVLSQVQVSALAFPVVTVQDAAMWRAYPQKYTEMYSWLLDINYTLQTMLLETWELI